MTRLNIEIHDSLIDVQTKIKNIKEMGIELVIPNGALILDNVINIKVLKKIAQKEGVVLTFSTEDPKGRLLLDLVEEGSSTNTISPYIEYTPKPSILDKLKGLDITGTFLNLKGNGIKNNSTFNIWKFIPLILIVSLFVGGVILINKTYKASANITVESQNLTRSITIKVKKDSSTDYEKNILKGTTLQETLQSSGSAPTTGTKYTGTKAKGTVTVYNKTDAIREFDKEEILIFEDEDTEYKYILTEDVEVPASTESADSEGNPVIYPGEKEVEIEALEIGEEYNIDENKTLSFDEYKSSQYNAKVKTDIKGGKKESKKAVDAKDIEKLKETLLKDNTEKVQSMLNKNKETNKYIKGSENILVIKEEISNKIGDETDTLTIDQTITAEALAYNQSDLDSLVNTLIKNLLPEGYEIAKQDKEIKVDILGNSTNSILSKTEADIQVTVKVSIIPIIDIDKLKNNIKGSTLEEAQKTIGSLGNVKTYELSLFPNLPFIKKIPNKIENINIIVEKE